MRVLVRLHNVVFNCGDQLRHLFKGPAPILTDAAANGVRNALMTRRGCSWWLTTRNYIPYLLVAAERRIPDRDGDATRPGRHSHLIGTAQPPDRIGRPPHQTVSPPDHADEDGDLLREDT